MTQPTVNGIPPKQAAAKFGRKKSWLWARVKHDPQFPRPFYIAPKAPLFVEAELDAYIASLAAAPRVAAPQAAAPRVASIKPGRKRGDERPGTARVNAARQRRIEGDDFGPLGIGS